MGAKLATNAQHLTIKHKEAYDTIPTGYLKELEEEGQPFVLSERHQWLRELVISKLRDPVLFWRKMQTLPSVKAAFPASAKTALEELMPEPELAYRLRRRVSGMGSFGPPGR